MNALSALLPALSRPPALLCAALAIAFLTPSVSAQCLPARLTKVLAFDGGAGDQFGSAASISANGGFALVGAPFDDDVAVNSGAVYVYTFTGSTWSFQAKLKANDAQASDSFGSVVSISANGDRALVGVRLDDDNGTSSGSAYVFSRSGTVWTQQAKLKPADGAAGDEFGLSVSLDSSGTFAAVGSPFDDIGLVANPGSAYVFRFSGGSWTETDKMVAVDLAPGDNLGAAVAISSNGGRLIVGAPLADFPGQTDAGAAYVFGDFGSGFMQASKLAAPGGLAGDQLGDSVAFNSLGTIALGGAIGRADNGPGSGAAYVFTDNGAWSFQAKLLAQNGAASDQFGFTVALNGSGNRAAVGAPLGDGVSPDTGASYVFASNLGNWAQLSRQQASDGAFLDRFGQSVALTSTGDKLFTGAQGDDDLGADAGSAHLFPTACSGGSFNFFCFGDGSLTTPCPCGNLGATGRGCSNSLGQGALLNAVGITSPDTMTLTSSGELPTVLSIFLQGDQENPGGVVFGDGVRCVSGSLKRLYIKNATNGTVTAPEPGDASITARSAVLGDTIQPGTTRFYQVYYRDPDIPFCPNPPGNSWNVSGGVRIFW